MQTHVPSYGPPPPIPSYRNSRDFVSEFPGQNTSTSMVKRTVPQTLIITTPTTNFWWLPFGIELIAF
jgi:hypothetical protein